MACCLTTPSHYLNQCWVLIREVLWHSLETDFTIRTQITFLWIIPSVWIWGYVLHVEHISCVIIAACLAHFMCHFELWPTSVSHPFSSLNSPLLNRPFWRKNITRILPSLSSDLSFKILLFQVAFLIFFSIVILSLYISQVGLLLQYMAVFQLQN